jgi:hypothetical protein
MSFGLHYSDTIQGRVFSQASTPLGLAVGLYTGTATGLNMPLFNPPGSNRNVELISLDVNWVSGATVNGCIGIMGLPLTAVATGTLCTAFASSTPVNRLAGSGNASRILSSNSSAPITVTAGTAAAPSATAPGWMQGVYSFNQELSASATPQPGTMTTYDFKGTFILPQGFMIYLAANLATVALYALTWTWKEVPINPQQG